MVTNSNFPKGFSTIPLPLPAQLRLSNGNSSFTSGNQGQLQPAERTQKEKSIGANSFAAQINVPQAASQVPAVL